VGKLNVTRIWKNFGIGSAAKICPMSESSYWRTLSCIAPMSVLPADITQRLPNRCGVIIRSASPG
jgi:hypothetical protein